MRSSWLAPLAAILLSGCTSAKISDAYMSSDSEGVRLTSCFRPEWTEIYTIWDILSFRDDTLITPILYPTFQEDAGARVVLDSEEVQELGSFAPGKGDQIISVGLTTVLDPPPPDPPPEEPEHCGDLLLSGNETDLNCGGACARCALNKQCSVGEDCETGACIDGACSIWPRGSYRLALFLNDEFVEPTDTPTTTLDFRIGQDCPCRPFPHCEEAPDLEP